MKSRTTNGFLTATLIGTLATTAYAADRFWDGGTADITGDGNGASTYNGGTWNTSTLNWDAGAAPHVAWNNSNLDNAIFAGTFGSGTKTVTIGSNITVNQIQINTGSTGGNRYDIGASASQNDFAISFGGTYSDALPTLTGNGGSNGFLNTNFNAKITGTIQGDGLVINHGSDGTNPGAGRFAFTNANNDFTGNIVVKGGNVAMNFTDGGFGAATNKIVLRGGSLFAGGAGTLARDVVVETNSGMAIGVTASVTLAGNISGAGNLTQYISNSPTITLSGGMSGYTGTFEVKTGTTLIQSTSASNGTWKLTSGTLKLNTADNTHIADGAGKSDLLMNGGTLDMNGKSETINGLSGTTGTVQNQASATTSTLTLGAGDTTASFGGTIRNNSGTGGTLSLVKIGSGIQTLSGTNGATGNVQIQAGTLALGASTGLAPTVTLGTSGGGTGTLDVTAKTSFTQANVTGNGTMNIGAGKTVNVSTSLAPGFSTGTLNVTGNLTIGGTTTMELAGTGGVEGVDSDDLNITGTLTLGGILNITSYNGYNLTQTGTYNLFDAVSFTGDFASVSVGGNALTKTAELWLGSFGGSSYEFDETNGVLTVVPEPATALLGGLGLLALLRRRR